MGLKCVGLCTGLGAAASGAATAGRATVDFDSLSFAQEGHFMSNKKCDLPKGSHRTAFKVGPGALHIPVVSPAGQEPHHGEPAYTMQALR